MHEGADIFFYIYKKEVFTISNLEQWLLLQLGMSSGQTSRERYKERHSHKENIGPLTPGDKVWSGYTNGVRGTRPLQTYKTILNWSEIQENRSLKAGEIPFS